MNWNKSNRHTPTVNFQSSDERLDAGFAWAKKQAMVYVRYNDPVGDWYEAALPGRHAFCMRDTAHQSAGASVLGLSRVTKNMLRKFAQSIAESRDFCSFWEIDRLYRPAPVDYTSDADFWYNLPANFDVLDACLRQYQWTGDEEYLRSDDFIHFYDLTVSRYVARWDIDGDGILERAPDGSRRGIASYDETASLRGAEVMSDMLAIQARGYESYAAICRLRGLPAQAAEYAGKAAQLRQIFAEDWWDAEHGRFFKARFLGGGMFHGTGGTAPDLAASHLALYYGGVTDPHYLELELAALADVARINVEALTYFPGIFYRFGQTRRAFDFLLRLIDPRLKRRSYPEVSFCVVGYYAEGLMGVHPTASELGSGLMGVETHPGLPADIHNARMDFLPLFDGTISVEHGGDVSTFENNTGKTVEWKAFPRQGEYRDNESVITFVENGEKAQVSFK